MNVEQKGISSAGKTSAGETSQRYYLLFNILFFQYSLMHDLALFLVLEIMREATRTILDFIFSFQYKVALP